MASVVLVFQADRRPMAGSLLQASLVRIASEHVHTLSHSPCRAWRHSLSPSWLQFLLLPAAQPPGGIIWSLSLMCMATGWLPAYLPSSAAPGLSLPAGSSRGVTPRSCRVLYPRTQTSGGSRLAGGPSPGASGNGFFRLRSHICT